MIWHRSHRADPRARTLADRHYSRQRPGHHQFVKPGACIVLLAACGRALWVTVRQRFVGHAWPGAWECALFRNEGAGRSSDLIREAMAATVAAWGPMPDQGLITFVDPDAVRRKRDPGRCFRRAGFRPVGVTASGLVVLAIAGAAAPQPAPAVGQTYRMEGL